MFCGKCGSQIPDGSGFCGSCGAPVGQKRPIQPQGQIRQQQQKFQQNVRRAQSQQTYAAQQSYYDDSGFAAPKPVSNKKKFMILGIIAAAVVVVILLIIFLGGGSTATPEGTIKKLEKGLNDLNTQTIMECFDAESQSYFSGSDYDLKGIADAFGIKYTYALNPTYVSPSYTQNGKEYCDVTVDITISYSMWGQSSSDNTTETIRLVHENGQWKIPSEYYSSMMGSLGSYY